MTNDDLSSEILFLACLCLFLALTEAAPFNAVGPHYNGDISRVPHFSIQVRGEIGKYL